MGEWMRRGDLRSCPRLVQGALLAVRTGNSEMRRIFDCGFHDEAVKAFAHNDGF